MRYKQTLLLLLFVFVSGVAAAQNNTNSPYTRYGYGQLSDVGSANSRAMGGVAYGLRDNYFTNYANPASYTAIDSLSFVFEGGVTLQNTNFDDGKIKRNAKNSSFDYLTMHFRFNKALAMSLGLVPYSNVGYKLSRVEDDPVNDDNSSVVTYGGDGGLRQAYVGLGFRVRKGLSVGMNVGYLWGGINHTLTQTFPLNASALPFTRTDEFTVKSYKMDFGVQYTRQLGKKHFATVGAVFSPGHNLSNKAFVEDVLGNSSLGYTTTHKDTLVTSGIPTSIGLGVTYIYDGRLTIGLDGTYQNWSKTTYMNSKDAFCDMFRVSLGGEYMPSPTGRSFLSRTKYRLGAYYTKPYYKMEGKRGTEEFGLSAGFGIPLVRSQSYVNITAQYVKVSGKTAAFLNENMLRLSVGVTFNQRWFYKFKVD